MSWTVALLPGKVWAITLECPRQLLSNDLGSCIIAWVITLECPGQLYYCLGVIIHQCLGQFYIAWVITLECPGQL